MPKPRVSAEYSQWLSKLVKGDTVSLVIDGYVGHNRVRKTTNATVLRASGRYIEIEGFVGKINRATGEGRDNRGLRGVIAEAMQGKMVAQG